MQHNKQYSESCNALSQCKQVSSEVDLPESQSYKYSVGTQKF